MPPAPSGKLQSALADLWNRTDDDKEAEGGDDDK
jgi:hypothetical protein